MQRIILFLFVISCTLYSCKKNYSASAEKPSIEGFWYFIENDSVYGEIFFTKDHFWTLDDGAGEIFLRYSLENDSVKLIDWDGNPYITAKFILNSNDEFELSRPDVVTHYYKLNISIDTTGLIQNDEKVFKEYLQGFRERRYKWKARE